MWDTAHALRHPSGGTAFCAPIRATLPAIRQLMRTLRADPGSPVGIVVDDVGRRGAAGWDELTYSWGRYPAPCCWFDPRGGPLPARWAVAGDEVRRSRTRARHPDLRGPQVPRGDRVGGLAGAVEEKRGAGPRIRPHLSAGRRFEDTLGEQVAARRGDPAVRRSSPRCKTLAMVGAAGATAEADRLPPPWERRSRGRRRPGSVGRRTPRSARRGRRLGGLHQLRSAELVRLTARRAAADRGHDLRPGGGNGARRGPRAARRRRAACTRRHDARGDPLAGGPAGARNPTSTPCLRRCAGWAARTSPPNRPTAGSRCRVWRRYRPRRSARQLCAASWTSPSPTLARVWRWRPRLAPISRRYGANASTDPRRALFDALPAGLVGQLVAATTDAATLDRFLAAQGLGCRSRGRPERAVGRACGPRRGPVRCGRRPAWDPRRDRPPLARQWVDAVGETTMWRVYRPRSPGRRPSRSRTRPTGASSDATGTTSASRTTTARTTTSSQICVAALALSPASDVAASAAVAPNGEPAGFNGHNLAEKQHPEGATCRRPRCPPGTAGGAMPSRAASRRRATRVPDLARGGSFEN